MRAVLTPVSRPIGPHLALTCGEIAAIGDLLELRRCQGADFGQTKAVNIEVTRILGDGSIRRVSVQPEERADADRWRELVDRANLALPPPYNPDPGRPVYQVSDGNHSIEVAERGLVGPLRDLVAAVLAEGDGTE